MPSSFLAGDKPHLVWPEAEHIFCDNEPFTQAVLRKHWPSAKIFGDIRTLTYAGSAEQRGVSSCEGQEVSPPGCIDLLTGGFPCQPFSTAGKRRGKEDDRYLWPEMLRVIRETKPRWIVGENVAGIINMALDQVCADLENESYEVQPFVIPACAVNAPHQRKRVWIVAHGKGTELSGKWSTPRHGRTKLGCRDLYAPHASIVGRERAEQFGTFKTTGNRVNKLPSNEAWEQNWIEVASRLCRVDDGVSRRLDKNPRLKALGNAIVPQVATEIFKAIDSVEINAMSDNKKST